MIIKPLPPRQNETLEYYREYFKKHGYCPMLKEAAEYHGVAIATVKQRINALVRKGFMRHPRRGFIFLADRGDA